MFKGFITGLLLWTSTLFAQNKDQEEKTKFFYPDSVITTELDEIIVEAKNDKQDLSDAKESGFMTVYYNDANKIAMSEYSGVFTIVPIYSRLRIDNMDPKFVGISYKNIPLIMDNTQLHGGISIINSQMSELQIKKTAYSSKYISIGGVMELFPKNFEVHPALMLASDFIERSALYNDKFSIEDAHIDLTMTLRNIGVPTPLEKIVEQLKILPDIYEISNNTAFSKKNYESEIFFRMSRGSGDFYDDNEDISLREHSSNIFFLTRHTLKSEKKLAASITFAYELNKTLIDYDFGDESNSVKNYNKNITLAADVDYKNFSLGSRMFFLSNANLTEHEEKKIVDLYGEYTKIFGNLLFEPSIRVMTDENSFKSAQGINITYFIEKSAIGVGYTHPVNMLVIDNSSGEKNYSLNYLGDQFADHYVGFLNIKGDDISSKLKGIIDEIDISYYHKYFNAYKKEGEPDKGYVNGWDFMIRNFGEFNYSIKFSSGNAIFNGHKMNEAVEDIASIDFGFPISSELLLNTQYMYNGGYNVRVRADNSSHTVGKAHYISTGLTYKFSLLGSKVDLSVTLFNILKAFGYENVPEFARYKVGDSIKSIKMPSLGDMRININVKF